MQAQRPSKIAISYGRPLPDDVMKMIDYIDNPRFDLVALHVTLHPDDLQSLLDTVDPIGG
jgi:ATP-dependent Lon protease